MFSWLTYLFDTNGYPARWLCGPAWEREPVWGWASIVADGLIWLTFAIIAVSLLRFFRQRPDMPYRQIFCLFGLFLFACGTSHLVESLLFWWPIYRMSAVTKLVTAAVSAGTAVALLRVLPEARTLRSPRQWDEEVRRRVAELESLTIRLRNEIQARELAERVLRESEERLRLALRAGDMGTWEWDIVTDEARMNSKEFNLFSFDGDVRPLPMERLYERIHEEDRRQVREAIRVSLRDKTGFEQEFRVVDREGNVRWLAGRGNVIRDSKGMPLRVAGVHFEITGRKRAEERLRLSERAFQTISNGILIADARSPDLPVVYANDGVTAITGYPLNEVIGRNCRFLQGEETSPAAVQSLREGLREGREIHTVMLNYRKDGTAFWNDLRISPVLDDGGRLTHFVAVQTDVTEQKRTEQALYQSANFLRRALDSLFVLAGVCTADGTLIAGNRAMLDIAGMEPDDVLGQRFTETAWWPRDAASQECVREAMNRAAAGETCRFDTSLVDAKGERRAIDLQIVPMRNDDGQVTHLIASGIDITERKQFERSLELARQQANAASQAKSEFLATMSHEIRTPLTGILGCADTLFRRLDTEEQRELLQLIRGQSRVLLALLNDILDVAKIESRTLEIVREPTSIKAIIEDVFSVMNPLAVEKGLELRVAYASPLPVEISTDAQRIRQILLNLVGNAVKFTEQGEVSITAQVETRADEARLRITVQDTGAGIPRDRFDSIFGAFRQERVQAWRSGGTGLGLTICRGLARLLGGDVQLESELGRGSTFFLDLPLGKASLLQLRNESEITVANRNTGAGQPQTRLPCRVLVVDDTRGLQFMLRRMLEEVVEHVGIASNGAEAIDEVNAGCTENRPYDVVLMDMHMPVLNGFEATARLRGAGHRMTIIALTAGAMAGDRDRCLAAGCDHYIAKPIEYDRLISLIEQHCRQNCGKEDSDPQ